MQANDYDTSIDFIGVASVLKSRRLGVPVHQRSFSWTRNEIGEFLEDIGNAFSDQADEYFLGTIVIIGGGNGKAAEVLDGQQRLATVTLTLSSISGALGILGDDVRAASIRSEYIESLDFESADLLPQFRLNDEDDPYFRRLVNGERLEPAPGAPESHRLLYDASERIRDWLQQRTMGRGDAIDWLVRLTTYLKSRVRVILMRASSDTNAYRIFETLNDRGLDLSISDLLKNYLLGRAGEDKPAVLGLWKAAIGYFQAYGGQEVFRTYLRHYWSSRHEVVRERELYKEIKRTIVSRSDVLDLARELRDNAYFYSAIISDDHDYWTQQSPTARERIRALSVLGLEQFRPLLLPALKHLNVAEVDDLLRLLINWNVRLLIVGGLGSGPLEKAYSGLGKAIRAGELMSVSDIRARAAQFVPPDDEFEAAFQNARISKIPLARYYLRTLELEQRGSRQPEVVPNPLPDQVTLEHVLPQVTEGNWPNFSEDEVDAYCRRLGNMVLLRQALNSSLKSAPFTKKRAAFADSELELTKAIAAHDDWGKQEIIDRQRRLAALAVKAWPLA